MSNRKKVNFIEQVDFNSIKSPFGPLDLFHNQDFRQGQLRAGAETCRLREAAQHVGRRVERSRQIR